VSRSCFASLAAGSARRCVDPITGGSISHNEIATSGSGGAVSAQQGELRIDSVRMEGNSVPTAGVGRASAVDSAGATVVLASALIASNTGGIGAVIAAPDASNASSPVAGAIVIVNSTIADNAFGGVSASSPLTIVNSAIVRQPFGIKLTGSPAPVVSVHTNVLFSNTDAASGLTLDATNLLVDPRLDGKLHLTASSPLIDAGQAGPIQTAIAAAPAVAAPSLDIDGEARSLGARPDIGADEYRPSP
jgi:hypothetical protein